MTNVYLSAAFERRAEMREIAKQIEAIELCKGVQDFRVVSSWIHAEHDVPVDSRAAEEVALKCWEEIASAHAFIAFASPGYTRGGRHVELGVAMELGAVGCSMRGALVGKPENHFQALSWLRKFDDVPASLAWLKETVAA